MEPSSKTENHPARFSQSIISVISEMLPPGIHVHDPFAGDGRRLGALCDSLGLPFSGTEIEDPFIQDHRVRLGDSTQRKTYPRRRYVICTSPAYPNGISDHFEAKDESTRKTYRQARANMVGQDAELHPNNMSRWGYRGTKRGGKSIKRREYWRIAHEVADCWETAEAVILNVSDFISGPDTEPLVQDWIDMLMSMGWVVDKDVDVKTPRMKNGSIESRDQRVEAERVILFR